MTVISTTYKKSPNRVICYDPQLQGRYEVRARMGAERDGLAVT